MIGSRKRCESVTKKRAARIPKSGFCKGWSNPFFDPRRMIRGGWFLPSGKAGGRLRGIGLRPRSYGDGSGQAACCRSLKRWILPVAVLGRSETK